MFAAYWDQKEAADEEIRQSGVEQVWHGRVGYPARPHHAARYGTSTTTLEQWAASQD